MSRSPDLNLRLLSKFLFTDGTLISYLLLYVDARYSTDTPILSTNTTPSLPPTLTDGER
ncbi:MAG: hypothetical protein IIT83_10135 [Bacteroidales bacterium]|nr:hypothetical protein [Bacteroidales bacterium]